MISTDLITYTEMNPIPALARQKQIEKRKKNISSGYINLADFSTFISSMYFYTI